MKKFLRYGAISLTLITVFVAGVLVGHLQFAEADTSSQGLTTIVYEILAGGSPTIARSEANETGAEIDTLRWGDRVLWDGQTFQNDAAGNRWIRVFLADGSLAWIPANFTDVNTRIKSGSSTYLTAGIEVGGSVTVSNIGNRANMRSDHSVSADLIREVSAGEVLQVIGGPVQSEYLMWWQYQDAQGNTGWIVDIEGWFLPAN